MFRRYPLVAAVAALVVMLAACGDSGTDTPDASGSPTTVATALTTELGPGVTDGALKLGVTLVDFECIKPYVDSIRLDQDKIYGAFIDYVNKNGGVAGRQIQPVYKSYCPIQNAEALQICTELTEDEKVFAVVGTFVDFSGDAQTCIAKRHNTPVITFTLTEAIMKKSDPGMILFPGQTAERGGRVLFQLMREAGTLEGKKVGILGETVSKPTVDSTVEPGLKELGVETGTTAILNITDDDTSAAQAQLDSFIERWKADNITALYITGTQVLHRQFIEKIKAAMPDLQLVTEDNEALSYGRQAKRAGLDPNPYEGIISATGPSADEYGASANWAECKRIYKEQTGKDAPGPTDVVPGPDGKALDDYGTINDACQVITMLDDIGEKVGQYLNADNWKTVVGSFGPIRNLGGGEFASLGNGKFDVNDTFRLSTYDSSLAKEGDWKPLTELRNVTGS
jgi:ABC-type branched-subunit amino acid transport system substrate-binding protein